MNTPDDPTPRPQARAPLRLALLLLAWLSAGIGFVGIFVPGLPTTVFILVSAWAASRSSPRFHAWLQSHPVLGPTLRDWRQGGRVSRQSKWAATIAMSVCAIVLFLTSQRWLASLVTAIMASVLFWLWRRPLPLPAGENGAATSRCAS